MGDVRKDIVVGLGDTGMVMAASIGSLDRNI
jgi:hypothetical protein